MTIAFTGGRNFNDTKLFESVMAKLDFEHNNVVVGDATGLDTMVANYINEIKDSWRSLSDRYDYLTLTIFKADWTQHGKAAGPIRNKQMLKSGVELLVAFPGGRGTEDCVRQAKQMGIPVLRVE